MDKCAEAPKKMLEKLHPKTDEVWIHLKTGNPYQIIGHVKMKELGEWTEGVLYTNATGLKFVRNREHDFMQKFVRIETYNAHYHGPTGK